MIRVGREWLLPALRDSYQDTAAAADGADLLVSHPLAAYAARLVAEKTRRSLGFDDAGPARVLFGL